MKKIFYILSSYILGSPISVLADGGTTPGSAPTSMNVGIVNPLNGISTLPQLITAILNNVIMPVAAVFIVIMIIYSGFKFITAQGAPGEIAKARQGLLGTLIGAAVLLGAAGIAAAISGTICGSLISCS